MSVKKTSKKTNSNKDEGTKEIKKPSSYEALGVSSKKEDVHDALKNVNLGLS